MIANPGEYRTNNIDITTPKWYEVSTHMGELVKFINSRDYRRLRFILTMPSIN